ncbi:MAG TPA: beta-glucosidase [Leptolyngbyaceae cyanobacterium M65_K2018_010]|nr:beta-glucosidase [Leptolyngbyaceae cyanobacterium M65_K2018_010]
MVSPALPAPEGLSLAEQVAQMVVVRASGHLFDHEIRYPAWEADRATLTHYITDLGIGGVILLGGSAAEVGLKTQDLQTQTKIPLLIAADIEEGVGQRFSGATWFPPPMALAAIAQQDRSKALDYATAMGSVTAAEALAIGLNWVLAPVVDVNNNPLNPVINVRAFGDRPELVAALTEAFLRGARRHNILTTAKHFPGHGDTALDSHLELPRLSQDLARLKAIELPPFAAAIAAGVEAVMTAHLHIPALDGRYPATLSAPTLTGLLRQEMGFDGLIVTDALVMGAITRSYGPYEAAVLAIEAGADVLLMPPHPEGAIAAVVEAVNTGRLSPERILASVERLWRAKQRVGAGLIGRPDSCHAWEHVPPPPVQFDQVAQPASQQLAARVVADSMTVVGSVPPCRPMQPGDNLVLVDQVIDCSALGRTAPALTWPEQYHYRLKLIDHQGCQQWPQAAALRPSLVQLFIRGNPFRGSATVSSLAIAWVETLLAADLLRGLILYGSPYAFADLRSRLGEPVPLGFTYGQMPVAQSLMLTALGLPRPQGPANASNPFTD